MVVGVVIATTTMSSAFANNLLAHNAFGYIGQPANGNTHLLTLGGYRHYNPTQGTFLKQDSYSPFANNRTFNGFNYSAGNPVLFADKSGHKFTALEDVLIGLGIMAVIGTAVVYYKYSDQINTSFKSLFRSRQNINNAAEIRREDYQLSEVPSSFIQTPSPEEAQICQPLQEIADNADHTPEERDMAKEYISELINDDFKDINKFSEGNRDFKNALVLGAVHALQKLDEEEALEQLNVFRDSLQDITQEEKTKLSTHYYNSRINVVRRLNN